MVVAVPSRGDAAAVGATVPPGRGDAAAVDATIPRGAGSRRRTRELEFALGPADSVSSDAPRISPSFSRIQAGAAAPVTLGASAAAIAASVDAAASIFHALSGTGGKSAKTTSATRRRLRRDASRRRRERDGAEGAAADVDTPREASCRRGGYSVEAPRRWTWIFRGSRRGIVRRAEPSWAVRAAAKPRVERRSGDFR